MVPACPIVTSQNGPAAEPREEDVHAIRQRDGKERNEDRRPFLRERQGSFPSRSRAPKEKEPADRDVPDDEAHPQPANLRRGPLGHHREAWMSREHLGAASPEHPRRAGGEHGAVRPPPGEDVGIPAPRLEEVEHPSNLPGENARAHQKPRHVRPEEIASIETPITGLQLRPRLDPRLHTGPPVSSVDDRDGDEREPEMSENDLKAHFLMVARRPSHHALSPAPEDCAGVTLDGCCIRRYGELDVRVDPPVTLLERFG